MSSGVPQEVLIASPQEAKNDASPPEVHRFLEETAYKWSVTPSRAGARRIRISARGLIDLLDLRVENGSAWIAFRFDLLTGLPRNERSSF